MRQIRFRCPKGFLAKGACEDKFRHAVISRQGLDLTFNHVPECITGRVVGRASQGLSGAVNCDQNTEQNI